MGSGFGDALMPTADQGWLAKDKEPVCQSPASDGHSVDLTIQTSQHRGSAFFPPPHSLPSSQRSRQWGSVGFQASRFRGSKVWDKGVFCIGNNLPLPHLPRLFSGSLLSHSGHNTFEECGFGLVS